MAQNNGDGPTPSAEKRNSGLNFRLVTHAVKRHPWVVSLAFVLALSAGAGIFFFLPLPKMTGVTVFQVAVHTPAVLSASAESRMDLNTYRQTQAAMIKRRLFLNKILNQPEVRSLQIVRMQPDPIGWLEKGLKVESQSGSEFLRVTMEGDNPDELQIILEAISKAFIEDVDKRDNGARRDRLANLEKTNQTFRRDMETFRKREEAIAMAIGSRYGPTLAQLDILQNSELTGAITTLQTARNERFLAEQELKNIQSNLPGMIDGANPEPAVIQLPWNLGQFPGGAAGPPIPATLIEAQINRDPGYQRLEDAVSTARKALAKTREFYSERTQAVIDAEIALQEAETRRDKYREELRPLIEAEFRKQLKTRELDRVETLRANIASAINREKVAEDRVKSIQAEIKRKGEYQGELDKLRFDTAQTEKLSVALSGEIEHLKVELGAPSRVALAEEPYVMAGIEGNRRMKYTALAVLGVLFAGLAGVVVWESQIKRLTHPDDLATALGVRVIGTVPLHGAAGQGAGTEDPHPVLVEAIDATRTMLLHGTPNSDLRLLVVTSAVSGEGKTSLTGHLAISLARAGFRTLLVDGDLRAPTAQQVFNVPLSPGLSEVLSGADLAGVIHATGVPGLSVMPAGQWNLSARQGLVGDRWRCVKEQLKAEFDYVVVDSSPLLLVSDSLLLAREADGIVVSVLMGVSQLSSVNEAVGRLQRVRGKVVGVIANGVRHLAHQYVNGQTTSEAHLPVGEPIPER